MQEAKFGQKNKGRSTGMLRQCLKGLKDAGMIQRKVETHELYIALIRKNGIKSGKYLKNI